MQKRRAIAPVSAIVPCDDRSMMRGRIVRGVGTDREKTSVILMTSEVSSDISTVGAGGHRCVLLVGGAVRRFSSAQTTSASTFRVFCAASISASKRSRCSNRPTGWTLRGSGKLARAGQSRNGLLGGTLRSHMEADRAHGEFHESAQEVDRPHDLQRHDGVERDHAGRSDSTPDDHRCRRHHCAARTSSSVRTRRWRRDSRRRNRAPSSRYSSHRRRPCP